MNLPSKAWLDMNHSNGQWRLYFPNGEVLPNVRFHFGCMQQLVPVRIEPPSIKKVKNTHQIHVNINDEHKVRLGPLIGIFSVAKEGRLLGNRANFIDIIKAGRKLSALVFVFTPNDIDWEQMTVNGRFYDVSRKKWHQHIVPFPDVVYNRIPNRNYEASDEVNSTLQRLLQLPDLHLYNPHFFNKWELYQIIQASHLHNYLPESKLLTSPQVLIQLLQLHKQLYLKPSEGKAGNGIYLVSLEGDTITISSSFGGSKTHYQSTRIDQVWRWLQPKVAGQTYIIQQAIPLLQHYEAPFDIRVLVQKNILGEWDVSGVGYRVAGKNSVTTHVPQGGKIISKALALDPHFGSAKSDQLLDSIKETAINIAQTLDQHYRSLGEMSMDLGLTTEGRIWFFEANAKPMKFDEPNIRRTSLRRIIEYSKYLSRFT